MFDGDTVILDWTDLNVIEDKGSEGGMFEIFGGTSNVDVMATADIFNIILKHPKSDPILGTSDLGVIINGGVNINEKIVSNTATSALVIDSSTDNDETVLINTNSDGTVVNSMAEFKRYQTGGVVRFNSYDVNGADFGSQLVLNNDPLAKSITMEHDARSECNYSGWCY